MNSSTANRSESRTWISPHVWATEKLKRRFDRMLPRASSSGMTSLLSFRSSTNHGRISRSSAATSMTYKSDIHARRCALLIDVSWSTSRLIYDRGTKRTLYASSSIPVYWMLNAIEQQVEVYAGPVADGYSASDIFKPGQLVPVVINGVAVGQIAVDEFMPEPDPAASGNGA